MAKIRIIMLNSGSIQVENLEGDVDIEWVDERDHSNRKSAQVDIPDEDELLDLIPIQFSHANGDRVSLKDALEAWCDSWVRVYDEGGL